MNNVFVDKLPHDCGECCFQCDNFCCISGDYVIDEYFEGIRHKQCPLKLLHPVKEPPVGCIPSEILAIVKLEEVKKDILKIDKTEIKTLKNGYSTLYVDRPEVITIIDQKIKQLKEK